MIAWQMQTSEMADIAPLKPSQDDPIITCLRFSLLLQLILVFLSIRGHLDEFGYWTPIAYMRLNF